MIAGATVFVVDDDPASRESVRALVDPMGVRTELYASAEEFLEAYDPSRTGCLVTDLRMLGMSGVELQQKLNDRGVRLPTIVVSAYADVPVTVRAMQQGALTVLEKPCRDTELWDAIRKALEQDARTRSQFLRRREIARRFEALTDGERKILDLIVQGTSNKTIAHRLDMGLRTVESRRKSIFTKTQTASVAELVELVVRTRDESDSDPVPPP
jgi:FixJ family two-component response regulator